MANVEGDLQVEIAWSPEPRATRLACVRLAAGATVADAIRACGWPEVQAVIDEVDGPLVAAVWGQACPSSRVLREGDRVEILRALAVDPMEARRDRFEAAGGVRALRRKRQALQPKKAGRTSGLT